MPKGGKRPGSGRPKGSHDKATLEKEFVLKAVRQRIMRKADQIVDAQFALASGVSFLFRIDVDSKKPVIVTDVEEISAYLDQNPDGRPGKMDGAYFYITTVKPDGYAIDSLLNRAFGKPASEDSRSSSGNSFSYGDIPLADETDPRSVN